MTEGENFYFYELGNDPMLAAYNDTLGRAVVPPKERLDEFIDNHQDSYKVWGRAEIAVLDKFAGQALTSLEVALVLAAQYHVLEPSLEDLRTVIIGSVEDGATDNAVLADDLREMIAYRKWSALTEVHGLLGFIFPNPEMAQAGHDLINARLYSDHPE